MFICSENEARNGSYDWDNTDKLNFESINEKYFHKNVTLGKHFQRRVSIGGKRSAFRYLEDYRRS
jgi:hypothetical protein